MQNAPVQARFFTLRQRLSADKSDAEAQALRDIIYAQ